MISHMIKLMLWVPMINVCVCVCGPEDPEERHDLTQSHPAILDKMVGRMNAWRATEVPALFPPPDPAADPSNWGGAWSPGWC